ncbi:restriction endonuclease subunit S [Algoriphagus pacificus]|uniref:Restriction endonuclease subunit S n=1 Tax=Algoriphagus pacificus TaxID=2811234 RepID=A0ABS3CI80_9BACT|nr:restriction endonuclease subunit S [Algoriphagus pacificus]MBN7816800.1 restriction endonuclease subunit S [Algoriphagus pacificus]
MVPEIRFNEFYDSWNNVTLGKVSKFSKGKGISKSDIDSSGNLECIRYGELYTHYGETISEIISRTNTPKKELILSEINDVIIPASGESSIDIAKASCVKKEGVALGGDLNIIKSKIDGVFLSYYLNGKRKIEIAKLAQGNSVVHLYPKQLGLLQINVPTKPEQQKIASFLSLVDEKINKLKEKKELLEQYKKGVMQQLFSQEIRFKDENGEDFPDWEELQLSEILYEHKTKNKENSITEVFSVAKHKGVINQIEHLGRSYSAKDIGHYKVILPGDVVYTKSPTSEFPFGIIKQNQTDRSGVVSPLYGVFTPDTEALGYILHEYFLSPINTYNYLNPLVQKGAKNTMNINNDTFLNGAQIPLPVVEAEQRKIAEFISKLSSKIELLVSQIEQLETWKKGLLQQMFV